MRPRILAILPLLAFFSPVTVRSAGVSSLVVRAQVREAGVQLSLAMPHGPFAWNSFIPVVARVVNVSSHAVKIGATEEGLTCFVKGPVVEVRKQDGTAVFPPSVPDALALPCPMVPPGVGVQLRPGAAMTWSGYVILRAAHVVARVNAVQGRQGRDVSTPAVTVRLQSMAGPSVTLHTQGGIYADLTRPPGARGPMLAAWWWDCTSRATSTHSAGGVTTRPSAVTVVGGTRLTPHLDHQGCVHLNQWHAVAGWSGFPAARIDYTAPPSITPTPASRPADGIQAPRSGGALRCVRSISARQPQRPA